MTAHDPALVERVALAWLDCDVAGNLAHARAVLDAITETHAVIELPGQMADRSGVAPILRTLPMWQASGDAWAMLREPDLIEFEADAQHVYGDLDVSSARALAAVLLAGANAAEVNPDCGHPNPGAPDHDCAPFTARAADASEDSQ